MSKIENSAAPVPRASFDVWLRWAEVVAARLSTIQQIYQKNSALPESENVLPALASRLARLQFVLNGAMAQHLSAQRFAILHETAYGQHRFVDMQIQALAKIFKEVIVDLPRYSADMQKLLNSRWKEDCNGRLATDLFRGPARTMNEGISSGYEADGQLPKVLADLLMIEATGAARAPRQATLSPEDQVRWEEAAKRWAVVNGRHFRTAGRVN